MYAVVITVVSMGPLHYVSNVSKVKDDIVEPRLWWPDGRLHDVLGVPGPHTTAVRAAVAPFTRLSLVSLQNTIGNSAKNMQE